MEEEEKVPRNVRFKDEVESKEIDNESSQTNNNQSDSNHNNIPESDPPETTNAVFDIKQFLAAGGNPIYFNGIEIDNNVSQEIDLDELK